VSVNAPSPPQLNGSSTLVMRPASEGAGTSWRTLYAVGAAAAAATVALIVLAVPVFIFAPPPTTAADHFAALETNTLVGLLGLDLLYVPSVALSALITLALCVALWNVSPSWTAIALLLGAASVITFFDSNPAFAMLALSEQYRVAATETQRAMLLGAGQAVLAIQQSTAYFAHYYLGAASGLIVSAVMLRSTIFRKVTGYVGVLAFALGLWPPVGTIGVAVSLSSAVVLLAWEVLVARRLLQLARGT
jgi:hypothetical protein